MKPIPQRIGLYASLTASISFVCFTICFIVIALTQNPKPWTTLDVYLLSFSENDQLFKHLAEICVIVFAVSYVVILHSLTCFIDKRKQVVLRTGISFAIIFTTLVSLNYFIQLTAVRFHIAKEAREGLDDWIMFNPLAYGKAIAMLGWTIMLGLSSFFVAPAIEGKGVRKAIRILFTLNGLFCLLGGLGYIIGNDILINLGLNLGMGGVLTALSILLVFFFRDVTPFSDKNDHTVSQP